MNEIVNWMNGWNAGGKTSIIWFVVLAILLVFSSIKIVKYADVLSVKTKFGGAVIGGILIAIVTAAPEFITSIQQSLEGSPATGSSDNIGANAITGLLIGLAALLFLRETFLGRLKKWTIATLWISFAISLFITLMMFFQKDINIGKKGVYAIGLIPLLLITFYFILLYFQTKFDDGEAHTETDEKIIKTISVKKALWLFCLWGLAIILFSMMINFSALSMESGFAIPSQSVGGLFLSIAMALPEGVAFFALLKKKQYTAAVSVLVGHGFALFVSEWLVDAAFAEEATYRLREVHEVWPISVITTICFALLGISALLSSKVKIFKENKIVYSILPTLTVLTYILGWTLILVFYY